jgi:hypothetical protein
VWKVGRVAVALKSHALAHVKGYIFQEEGKFSPKVISDLVSTKTIRYHLWSSLVTVYDPGSGVNAIPLLK